MIKNISFLNNFAVKTSFNAKNVSKANVSFGATEEDTFEKISNANDPWAKEKIQILNKIFDDQIRKMRFCVDYYKVENDEIINKSTEQLHQILDDYIFPTDFINESVRDIKAAKTQVEREMLIDEGINKFDMIIDCINNKDLDKLSSRLEKVAKTTYMGCMKNIQTTFEYCDEMTGKMVIPPELLNQDTYMAYVDNMVKFNDFVEELKSKMYFTTQDFNELLGSIYARIANNYGQIIDIYPRYCAFVSRFIND